MIKKLLLSLLFALSLFSSAETSDRASSMEMLLFKIGFTALVEEFESEKNITSNNSKKIALLEKNFELLVKFMEMTKTTLGESGDALKTDKDMQYGLYNLSKIKEELAFVLQRYKKEIQNDQNNEIVNLKKEIASLKRDINLILAQKLDKTEHKKITAKKDISNRFRVVSDSLSVKSRPVSGSKTTLILKRHDIVSFSGCDRYGWCRLSSLDGYAPKHLFLPAE